MISAESTASEIGQLDQLDRRDNIADIAEHRVKHIAKQVWPRDEDLKEKEGRPVNYADLKRLIQRQINIITTRNTLITPGPQVKVAPNVTTGSDQSRRVPMNALVTNGVRQQQDKSSVVRSMLQKNVLPDFLQKDCSLARRMIVSEILMREIELIYVS